MILVLCICVFAAVDSYFEIVADDWQDFRTWPKDRPLPNWRFAELAASLYFLSSQEDTGLPDNLPGALGDRDIKIPTEWVQSVDVKMYNYIYYDQVLSYGCKSKCKAPIHTKTQVIQTNPYVWITAGRSIPEF